MSNLKPGSARGINPKWFENDSIEDLKPRKHGTFFLSVLKGKRDCTVKVFHYSFQSVQRS
jgi:hypothetical protein